MVEPRNLQHIQCLTTKNEILVLFVHGHRVLLSAYTMSFLILNASNHDTYSMFPGQ